MPRSRLRMGIAIACLGVVGAPAAGCRGAPDRERTSAQQMPHLGPAGADTSTAAADPSKGTPEHAAVSPDRAPLTIAVRSAAFRHQQPIPREFSGDGANVSPPLEWSGAPAGTREWALVVDDPDAPTPEPWVHWVIYGLPGETASLPRAVPQSEKVEAPPRAAQGRNSWGSAGYRGPEPPRGPVHRYRFRLYALDAPLGLRPGLEKNDLLRTLSGHVLARGELIGTYRR